MLTVLSVAYPFARVGPAAIGGAEQVLWSIDRALTPAGVRSIVVAQRGSTCAGELVAIAAPEAPYTDTSLRATWQACRLAIERVLASEAVDVVHFHGPDCREYLPEPAGVPIAITLHLWPDRYDPSLFSNARDDLHFVCVSDAERAVCAARARSRTIPNGVDLSAFGASGARSSTVLLLGRIAPEKGFHLAIDAATAAGRPVVLAGAVFPYPAHREYFEYVIAPRLSDAVRFVGPVGPAEKRRLLSEAAVVGIPSILPETSSLVAMEALASGTPVVALRSPALEALIEHGRTGYLVRDVDEMRAAFASVDALSSAACRRVAEERCSIDRTVRGHLRMYEELAAHDREALAARAEGGSGVVSDPRYAGTHAVPAT